MNMKNNMGSLERIVLVMDKTIDFGIAIAGLGLIAYGLYDKNLLIATLGGALANLGVAMYVSEDDIPPIDYRTIDFRGRASYDK